jgi:hypothetical protein
MASNSFKRFGIDHLSPSSLNLWRAQPGWWVQRYIRRIKDEDNAAMAVGKAVEDGLAVCLRTGVIGLGVNAAIEGYKLNYRGPEDKEREAMIGPMLRVLQKWTPPSELNATQIKIEHWLDPIPVPLIGFVDFGFDGIDIDLKTTKACPSSPRADHIRQVSLYRAARGRWGGLLYVTDKRHAYYEVTDEMMEIGLKDLRSAALSLNNFLARCDTADDAVKSLPLDWDSFYAPKNKELVTA